LANKTKGHTVKAHNLPVPNNELLFRTIADMIRRWDIHAQNNNEHPFNEIPPRLYAISGSKEHFRPEKPS
jgi:hypothetical protein